MIVTSCSSTRVVAERRVDVLLDRDRVGDRRAAEVAGAEVARGLRALRAVGVERADRAVADAQVAVAARVVARRRARSGWSTGRCGPGSRACTWPRLCAVATMWSLPSWCQASVLPLSSGCARARVGVRIHRVAVGGQAPAVDDPAAEDAAAVLEATFAGLVSGDSGGGPAACAGPAPATIAARASASPIRLKAVPPGGHVAGRRCPHRQPPGPTRGSVRGAGSRAAAAATRPGPAPGGTGASGMIGGGPGAIRSQVAAAPAPDARDRHEHTTQAGTAAVARAAAQPHASAPDPRAAARSWLSAPAGRRRPRSGPRCRRAGRSSSPQPPRAPPAPGRTARTRAPDRGPAAAAGGRRHPRSPVVPPTSPLTRYCRRHVQRGCHDLRPRPIPARSDRRSPTSRSSRNSRALRRTLTS